MRSAVVFAIVRDTALSELPVPNGATIMARRKEVLTTGDVAEICQVAPRTVSKWFDSGQLKGYRVPGSKDRRIPVADLMKFMREHGMPLRGLESGLTKVLVVSPDRSLCDSVVESLTRQRTYECSHAESAFAAGVAAAKLQPVVVLVDVQSEVLCDAAIWSSAAAVEGFSAPKSIALAGSAVEADRCVSDGFHAGLVKPFEVGALVSAIDKALG